MSSSPRAIVANRLSYVHPDGTPLFHDLTFSAPLGRYGLIGPNGVGKSTLLRLIGGALEPSSGNLRVTGTTAYLEQNEPAEERGTLSGGERMRLRLARMLRDDPVWLLLDEPTNHLDREGRTALYELVERWRGGIVVASHDRELLTCVDRILELSSLGMRVYGGAFDLYAEQRRLEDAAAAASVVSAESRLAHERRDLTTSLERSQRSASHGKQRALKKNVPKVMRGALERKAQATAAKRADTHEDRVHRAQARLDTAKAAVRREPGIVLDLPRTSVHATKPVAICRGLNVVLPGGSLLWPVNLDLELVGPRHVALAGRNGSGKTTLLRILAGQTPQGIALEGSVAVGVRTAYLDQHLDFLPQTSLVAAMRETAPHLAEHERRVRLGRLLFEQERGLESIAHFSGGERVRAALALLFWSPAPPQLLLLDEPTNNLDLQSTEHVIDALRSFQGAIVVVSHDRQFLDAIGVEREVTLVR